MTRGVLILALLVAAPVRAQDPGGRLAPVTHVSIATSMALSAVDLAQTLHAVGTAQAREANPIFAPFVHTPLAAGALKVGVAVGNGWLLWRLAPAHPRLALLTSVLETGALTAVVVHNARLSRTP